MWGRSQNSAPRPPRRRTALARLAGLAALGLAALAGLATSGCGRRVEPHRQERIGAAAEWAWLVAAKRQLDDKRGQLAGLGGPAPASLPGGGTGGAGGAAPGGAAAAPGLGGGGSASAVPAASRRDQLAREIDGLSQQLGRRLVGYINANPPIEGAPLSAQQLAAIRMKSDEEIAVAREFIARSGDYRRACEIYEAALGADPDNPRLREELARARAARYVSLERFSRAAPGMSPEQVRSALGPPNAHDVRAYPDKKVVGWFYPRDGSGAAAAVWFERREGKLTVYLCDWSAVPAPSPAAPAAPAAAAKPAAPPAPPPPPPAETAGGADAGDLGGGDGGAGGSRGARGAPPRHQLDLRQAPGRR
jgi:hypothetical protein